MLEQWPHWNWAGAAVAAAALLVLAICSRIPYVPGGLVAVVIGIVAGQWLDLPAHGVALIGVIELKLEVPSLPDLPFADWLRLGSWRSPW